MQRQEGYRCTGCVNQLAGVHLARRKWAASLGWVGGRSGAPVGSGFRPLTRTDGTGTLDSPEVLLFVASFALYFRWWRKRVVFESIDNGISWGRQSDCV